MLKNPLVLQTCSFSRCLAQAVHNTPYMRTQVLPLSILTGLQCLEGNRAKQKLSVPGVLETKLGRYDPD